jgi:hypothetical protein
VVDVPQHDQRHRASVRRSHQGFLETLASVLQIELTGVSGGPDGLPCEGQSEAPGVVGDGADGPAHLTGDLVTADAVSVELTEAVFVLMREGAGHGRLTPSHVRGDG